jgi:thiol-disulfide isomerase/thioredoxin
MKALLVAVVALALTLVRPAVGANAPPNFVMHETPKAVPEVSFTDEAGQSHKLSEFSGKLVLLNVWATWCAPCRKEMPTLDRLQATLGGPEFTILALSIDWKGPEVVKKFYDEIGITRLALYNDSSSSLLQAFGLVGLPVTLLINREGKEIGRLIGPAEWDGPEMIEFLKTMMTIKSGALSTSHAKDDGS